MISFIILGYRTRFCEYATPLMQSVRRYEPEVEIILVDCNSEPNYKPSDDYRLVRVPKPFNPSRCLNLGIAAAKGDWLMLSNDDVTCSGSFAGKVAGLDKGILYGNELVSKRIKVKGIPWSWYDITWGWLMILHRDLFDSLGTFDETTDRTDVEYSMRAIGVGVPIRAAGLPFKNIDDHRRG